MNRKRLLRLGAVMVLGLVLPAVGFCFGGVVAR